MDGHTPLIVQLYWKGLYMLRTFKTDRAHLAKNICEYSGRGKMLQAQSSWHFKVLWNSSLGHRPPTKKRGSKFGSGAVSHWPFISLKINAVWSVAFWATRYVQINLLVCLHLTAALLSLICETGIYLEIQLRHSYAKRQFVPCYGVIPGATS